MDLTRRSIFSVILLLLVYVQNSHQATRIYYSNCTQKGFRCVTNVNNKVDLTYDCSSGIDDISFFINQFSSPRNIESILIQNCNALSISTRCSGENKQIKKLQVVNVNRLSFQRLQYEPMLPSIVVFENISFIGEIPTKTFGQINKAYHTLGCYVQPVDFQNVYFRNVTIDTVQPNAFVGLMEFKNFSFVNVKINRIQTSAIQLKHNNFQGIFELSNCIVESIDYLGIQIKGKRSIFSDNQFTDIASSGINGTMKDFYFTKNFVQMLNPHGFSILATNIFILDNNFLYLKSAALEKLSPGLIHDSGRNFGKLRFVYDFSKNTLNFLDAASLHPDYVSYENVQTEMTFSRNKFMMCTCENIGWMFSALGYGPNTEQLETFYEMILDDGYSNVCVKSIGKSCNIPIRMLQQTIQCGRCLKNITLDNLCTSEASTTLITTTVIIAEAKIPATLLKPVSDVEYNSAGAICITFDMFIYGVITSVLKLFLNDSGFTTIIVL